MNQHVLSGVCAHSTVEAYQSYVIFCVGQCPYKIAAFKAWAAGRIGFKSLHGCYDGQAEQSFIANERHLPLIRPWLQGEESVLHLAPGLPRAATLRFSDGREESLGHLKPVTRAFALARDAWTFDPLTQQYFVCV